MYSLITTHKIKMYSLRNNNTNFWMLSCSVKKVVMLTFIDCAGPLSKSFSAKAKVSGKSPC